MADKKTEKPEDPSTLAHLARIKAQKVERADPVGTDGSLEQAAKQSLGKHRQRLADEDRREAEGAQRKVEARLAYQVRKLTAANRRLNRENKALKAALAEAKGEGTPSD